MTPRPRTLAKTREKGAERVYRYSGDLSDLPLFSEANRSEVATVRSHLTMLSVTAGRILVQEGAAGDQFMIITDGTATVSRRGRTIATLGRGALIGEMALLCEGGSGRRNATVTLQTDSTIYVGSRNEFHQILTAAPSVESKVRQTAAARLVVAPRE